MEPRLSLITLGVEDVARARAFYERLGFKASSESNPSVTFFNAGGVVLGLFGRAALAEDAHVASTASGFSGIALAHNVRSERGSRCSHCRGNCGRRKTREGGTEGFLGRLFWVLR